MVFLGFTERAAVGLVCSEELVSVAKTRFSELLIGFPLRRLGFPSFSGPGRSPPKSGFWLGLLSFCPSLWPVG